VLIHLFGCKWLSFDKRRHAAGGDRREKRVSVQRPARRRVSAPREEAGCDRRLVRLRRLLG
jgi:hypothetical protein